jgi:glycerol uptake facilitator-like aquaporin
VLRPSANMTLLRRCVAEGLGSAFLLAAVVGSGIMAQRLSGGNVAVALLANTLATAGVLVCLIAALGPISGAHFNPAVSLADALGGGLRWRELPAYVGSQLAGAVVGVATANSMFGLAPFSIATRVRSGAGQWLGEFVAAFGLMIVIWGCVRFRSRLLPFAVGAYIGAAYWFTSSTSFANPAVTIARSLSDTFTGIRPADVAPFVAAQLAGAAGATGLFLWLVPVSRRQAQAMLLPHDGETGAA